MAPGKDEKPSLEEVLKLAEQLTVDEREQLRLTLATKSWAERWDALTTRVRERTQTVGSLSDEEIVEQMKAVRREVWAERAESDR